MPDPKHRLSRLIKLDYTKLYYKIVSKKPWITLDKNAKVDITKACYETTAN